MTTAALAFVAMAASIVWSTPADAETRPRYGRTLVASLLGEPIDLDPHAASSHAEIALANLIFDGLYRVNDDGTIAPELATALPVIGASKLDVTICVRVGAAFHDGSTLTVADVVASLTRLSKGSAGWMLGAVSSIAAGSEESAGCVVLELRYQEPELARYLASPVAAITRLGKKPRARSLIGTGPFRLSRLDRNLGRVVLAAFDDHHRGRPYLDTLQLRWFRTAGAEARAYEVGDIHISARGAVAFSGHTPKYETSSAAGPATILAYVGFGQNNAKLLDDAGFRRALSLAIGRDGMRNFGTGERIVPTVGPVARALGAQPATAAQLSSQLEAAKAELDAAAARVPALTRPRSLRLEILVDRTRLDDRDVADKVLAALYKLDISASVVELNSANFAKRVERGACDLYIGQLAAPAATISAEIAAAFAAGRDSWARDALSRASLDLASALSEFRRRLPVVPLFHRALRVHHRNDVLGLSFDGTAQIEWADLFLFGQAKKN